MESTSATALSLSRLHSILCKFDDGFSVTVPEFLVRAFELLLEQHLQREGLFRKPGAASKVRLCKPLLQSTTQSQSNYTLEQLNAFDICDLIKCFFREIEEPLLTYGLQAQFIRFVNMSTTFTLKAKSLLQLCHALPPRHKETLAFLMRKLNLVAKYSAFNKMDADNLATLFVPVIFRQDDQTFKPKDKQSLNEVMCASKADVGLKAEVIRILIKVAESIGKLSPIERAIAQDEQFGVVASARFSCKSRSKNVTSLHRQALYKSSRSEQSSRSDSIETEFPVYTVHTGSIDNDGAILQNVQEQLEPTPSPDQFISIKVWTVYNKFSTFSNSPFVPKQQHRASVCDVLETPLGSKKTTCKMASLARSTSDPVKGTPRNGSKSSRSVSFNRRRLRRGRPNSLKAGLHSLKLSNEESTPTDDVIDAPRTCESSDPMDHEFADSKIKVEHLLSSNDVDLLAAHERVVCVRPSVAALRVNRRGMVSCTVRKFNSLISSGNCLSGINEFVQEDK